MATENSSKLCECGCGQPTTLAKCTDKRKGSVKGQPLRFLRGHFNRTHGQSHGPRTPTYRSWAAMKCRCENAHTKDFHYYGGRGIRVCERWQSFENFLADMGERPDGCSIERKDSDGNYEPQNCIWASQLVQVNNSSHNNMLTAFNKTQSLADWAREYQIPRTALAARIARGWPAEDAITSPIRPGVPKRSR